MGLANSYVTVPARFRWIDDTYAATGGTGGTGGTGQAPATRAANRAAVRAFLRWLHQRGYTGDLRRDWATVTSSYLLHLASRGNAASTILRQRSGLNDCATCVGLPPVTIPRHNGRAAPSRSRPARTRGGADDR